MEKEKSKTGRKKIEDESLRRKPHATTATEKEWQLILRFARIVKADYNIAQKLLEPTINPG